MTPLLPARAASGTDMLGAWRVNSVNCVDALALMEGLPSQSVHAIITDLPYGTTACSWDEIIPFAPMWAGIKRILKPRGVVVTTASQPFTSKLVMSNLEWFKYEWVWNKVKPGNILAAQYQPLKSHENIVVFSPEKHDYFPVMTPSNKRSYKMYSPSKTIGKHLSSVLYSSDAIYPKSIITFSNADNLNRVHPTQKPVALYEYLIRTYTQPGELVLDFCCGSGTTGVACVKTGRNYLLCDTGREYVDISINRIHAGFVTVDVAEGIKQPSLFAGLAG